MGKNIVIFSDGTGQRGGVLFDETRTNIFKLYRATRCGPDSSVDPLRQLTFYDPGIGTVRGGASLFGAIFDWIYNKICQATGLGLTRNMIDCYAAIVQMCELNDKIFLFGFSRGAYMVRCLAGVLALCGVPTQESGQDLKRDPVTAKRIAREAVKTVYQYTSSVKETEATPQQKILLEERKALAKQFREKYSSNNENGEANKLPYFIGAFDTVASLAEFCVVEDVFHRRCVNSRNRRLGFKPLDPVFHMVVCDTHPNNRWWFCDCLSGNPPKSFCTWPP